MTKATGEAFLQRLEASRLLTAEQMQLLRKHLPQDQDIDPRKLAAILAQRKLINRWQAEKLLTAKQFSFVLGKYRLLGQVGKGGRGTVYKAEQLGLGRIVALKVLPQELMNKEEAVQRFRREAEVAAALSHPNIIACYDAECDGETHFLVMEYMDGQELNRWIEQFSPLPVSWCCEVMRQASLGLQHAHIKGMVHRDIKPGNILVEASDTESRPVTKLLDMGFARNTADGGNDDIRLTQPWQVFGTPDYMSPEQAERTRDADIRSDIYSLGITFFKLLTGELPFQEGSHLQKLIARARNDAPLVTTIRPEIPEGVAQIVAKMLARLPEERYQTPVEVSVALEPFSMVKPGERLEQAAIAPQATASEHSSVTGPPTEIRSVPESAVSDSMAATETSLDDLHMGAADLQAPHMDDVSELEMGPSPMMPAGVGPPSRSNHIAKESPFAEPNPSTEPDSQIVPPPAPATLGMEASSDEDDRATEIIDGNSTAMIAARSAAPTLSMHRVNPYRLKQAIYKGILSGTLLGFPIGGVIGATVGLAVNSLLGWGLTPIVWLPLALGLGTLFACLLSIYNSVQAAIYLVHPPLPEEEL
ncbi:Serine/threonine-protein kinase PknB [Planctomycetales bacterium 10988]|nr:Serine/threonine-protein kinase PknB [Planctomycetales bacterium 10988]